MIVESLASWLSDFLILGVFLGLAFDVIRRFIRKKSRRNDTDGRKERGKPSDRSWLDEIKRFNPKGGDDD